jgi:hypothetical protein
MSNKSLAGFTGLFGIIAVVLAVVCSSCSSPVAVRPVDPNAATVGIVVKKFSFVDYYVFRIGPDSTYHSYCSGSTSDTTLSLKKTDMIIINAYVMYDDMYPEKYSLTVENDTTLSF